ncbi:MAG: Fe-S cluster assembly protein SufD [Clostridia bacterium]|nr:Fe-S cluster assembly protein SufD [Clostridia bacterium]
MNIKLNKVNEIPVKTYRWLKVNELNLSEVEVILDTEYKAHTLRVSDNDLDKVELNRDLSEVMDLNKFKDVRLSEELKDISEKNANSKSCLYIKADKKLEEPIIFNYELNNDNPSLIDNNIIFADKNCESTIIFKYSSKTNEYNFHNCLSKIYIAEGAKVKLIKVQNLNDASNHFDLNLIHLERDSKLDIISVEIGSKNSCTQYNSVLEGENSNCDLKSVYYADKDRIIDINYIINHIARRTNSSIDAKGVLDNTAKKVFRGTIDFKKGAIKSEAKESEHVILLSDKVKSDSIPLLLCSEDDVVGSHSASVGKIDEYKLFYLMSRGFNEKEAKKLIIEGSFSNIINEISDEDLKEEIMDNIKRRLEGDK